MDRLLPRAISGSGGGGGKGGGSSGAVPVEDPNTLQSDSTARIVDLLSAGEIEGLVNGAQSIYFDGTQLLGADGNYNFTGVTWDIRYGTPDQDYIPGLSAAEEELLVNVEILQATPVVRTLSGPVDAARITIGIPQMTYQDPSNGNMHGSSVEFTISIRPTGTSTWTQVLDTTITGKCVSLYQSSYRIELGGTNDWDVQVERVTADSQNINLVNAAYWSSVTLITDGKFQYPNSAVVSLTVDAQQFGSSIPTRAYLIRGIKCQIPSNYDPIARTYTGIWDGTFQTAWTDNPAWVFFYLVTDVENGIGDCIGATYTDKWSLYTIAQYCDELIPDGFGGMEPRYRFNYQFLNAANAYQVLQDVAGSWRGLVFFGTGIVKVIADMPEDSIKLVTPANVINGDLTYEGIAWSARHSVCLVRWNDPSNLCIQAIELVEDPDLIAELGWKPLDITAVGCTSRGQAHRYGKWALDTEKYATQTINYKAGFDHADVEPGKIIEVYDPDYQAMRLGGRLVQASSNSVTLDAVISVENDKVYTLRLIMPDNTLVSRVITNVPGDTEVLTFDDALEEMPVNSALWALTVSDLSPRLFRVLSITEGDDKLYTVTALFYDPTKYARVEENILLEAPIYTPYTNVTVDAPLNLSFMQYVYRSNGVVLPSVTFSWSPPNSTLPINSYQIQVQPPGQNWQEIISQRQPSYDVIGIDAGLWSVRVRCVGFNGKFSSWTTVTELLHVNPNAPDDISGLSMSLIGQTLVLKWETSTAFDHDHYWLKYQDVTTGASWDTGTDVLTNILDTTITIPANVGTYMLKDVNTAGISSESAAMVVTSSVAMIGIDVIATVDDAPGWAGTKTDTVVSSGVLSLNTNTDGTVKPDGYYQFANYYDLGAVFTARLSGNISAIQNDLTNVMSSWPTLSSVQRLSGEVSTAWGVVFEIQTTNDNPAGTPVWSDWIPFEIGDYTIRALRPRLKLTSSLQNLNIKVSDASMIIGMERRTSSQSNTSNPSGDTITVSPAFYGTPDFVVTPHNLNAGDYFHVTSKSSTGCVVQFFNSAGTGVSRDYSIAMFGHGFANS